ncbi:MAG: TIGR03862 family flavoprotein [Pseudomonadota bacterium]
MAEAVDALVIGSGPAGLMAAENLAMRNRNVVIVEAKPSIGRKFLMAGKSGLNITKSEPAEQFKDAFACPQIDHMVHGFGPEAAINWAERLGQETFIGSTGRVFPKSMKASPLLRAWARRLGDMGIETRTKWRWTGWSDHAVQFDTPGGPKALIPNVTVLACGGASWARLGSDGAWASTLTQSGIATQPFQPANAGLAVAWSPHMDRHFGEPVKATLLKAGRTYSRGEFTLSARGLEGGGIYEISRAVREGAPLTLDLLPHKSDEAVTRALTDPTRESLSNRLRKRLGLAPVKQALLREFAPSLDPADLAKSIKALPLLHNGLRPLDEAISTAGGIAWDALDENLMLKTRPGTFACGEMLDWEAPTGGYLITGCLATGMWAGVNAAHWSK